MNKSLLSCIESKAMDLTTFYGQFALGPFPISYGLTVANTLRRCLLSQLPGTAVTMIVIENTTHEYQQISGIKDCVLDIVLNCQQLVLTSDVQDAFPPQIAYLQVQGPKVVRARDLNLPFFIHVVDPDQYIATLTEKGHLTLRLLINQGVGHLNHTPNSPGYAQRVKQLQSLIDPSDTSSVKGLKKPHGTTANTSDGHNVFPIVKQNKAITKQSMAVIASNKSKEKIEKTMQITPNPEVGVAVAVKSNQVDQTEPNNQPISEHLTLTPYTSYSDRNFMKNAMQQVALEQHTRGPKQGYFPVDAMFSPVQKVNYTIETMTPNTEQVYFEVWTNGSIDPRTAIHQTVKSIIHLFLPFQRTHQFVTPDVIAQTKTKAKIKFIEKVEKAFKKNIYALLDKPSTVNKIFKKQWVKTQNVLKFQTILQKQRAFVVKQQKLIQHQKPGLINLDPIQTTSPIITILIKKYQLNCISKLPMTLLNIDLLNLPFSAFTFFLLKQAQISTSLQLLKTTPRQLLALPYTNKQFIFEILWLMKTYLINLNQNYKQLVHNAEQINPNLNKKLESPKMSKKPTKLGGKAEAPKQPMQTSVPDIIQPQQSIDVPGKYYGQRKPTEQSFDFIDPALYVLMWGDKQKNPTKSKKLPEQNPLPEEKPKKPKKPKKLPEQNPLPEEKPKKPTKPTKPTKSTKSTKSTKLPEQNPLPEEKPKKLPEQDLLLEEKSKTIKPIKKQTNNDQQQSITNQKPTRSWGGWCFNPSGQQHQSWLQEKTGDFDQTPNEQKQNVSPKEKTRKTKYVNKRKTKSANKRKTKPTNK